MAASNNPTSNTSALTQAEQNHKRKKRSSSTTEGTRGAQYHCDYCRKDITNVVRIKCAECSDFDLCLECFSIGVQVYPHKNTHAYRVMDHVTTPIFDPDWGADEELLLLEAIDTYGLGNWSDISAHLGSKNKVQCEEHYHNVYLSSLYAPLPDPNRTLPLPSSSSSIPHSSPSSFAPASPTSTDDFKKNKMKIKRRKTDSKGGTALSRSTSQSTSGAGAVGYGTSKPKPKTGLASLVGYLPNRGDFEHEYENDAELILADMEFKDEDTPWERELKLKVLEIYNSKLDARMERKQFILERGLLERKDKKRSKEEREIYNNLRVFARFQTAAEHEKFVQGLINEQRLRKRIEELQLMRLNGIKTLQQGELFTAEKEKREKEKGRVSSQESTTLTTSSSGSSSSTVSSLPTLRSRKRLAEHSEDGSGLSKESSGSTGGGSGASVSDFDISKLEGVEMLSLAERKLCTELQLIPAHYIVLKDRLIAESFHKLNITPHQAKILLKIDINKSNKFLDFCISSGWLSPQQQESSSSSSASSSTLPVSYSQRPSTPQAAAPSLHYPFPSQSIPSSTSYDPSVGAHETYSSPSVSGTEDLSQRSWPTGFDYTEQQPPQPQSSNGYGDFTHPSLLAQPTSGAEHAGLDPTFQSGRQTQEVQSTDLTGYRQQYSTYSYQPIGETSIPPSSSNEMLSAQSGGGTGMVDDVRSTTSGFGMGGGRDNFHSDPGLSQSDPSTYTVYTDQSVYFPSSSLSGPSVQPLATKPASRRSAQS